MTPDTQQRLDEIRERWAKGTPGPWGWWTGDGYRDDDTHEKRWRRIGLKERTCGPLIAGDPNEAADTYFPSVVINAGCGQSEYIPCRTAEDAEKIAAAPADIRWLLEEVERLSNADRVALAVWLELAENAHVKRMAEHGVDGTWIRINEVKLAKLVRALADARAEASEVRVSELETALAQVRAEVERLRRERELLQAEIVPWAKATPLNWWQARKLERIAGLPEGTLAQPPAVAASRTEGEG